MLAALTLGLVSAFRPGRPAPPGTPGPPDAAVAAPARDRRRGRASRCARLGVLGFSAVGFGGLLAGRSATLVVLPVTPLVAASILGAGVALLALAAGDSVPVPATVALACAESHH